MIIEDWHTICVIVSRVLSPTEGEKYMPSDDRLQLLYYNVKELQPDPFN